MMEWVYHEVKQYYMNFKKQNKRQIKTSPNISLKLTLLSQVINRTNIHRHILYGCKRRKEKYQITRPILTLVDHTLNKYKK